MLVVAEVEVMILLLQVVMEVMVVVVEVLLVHQAQFLQEDQEEMLEEMVQ